MSTFKTVSAFVKRVQSVTQGFGAAVLAVKATELANDIKSRHGRYPSDVRWAQLKPATVARKGKDTPLLQTGSLRGAVRLSPPNPDVMEVFTDHSLALIHELGAHGKRTKIPARPIWKPAVKKLEKTFDADMIRALERRLMGV